MDDPSEEQAYKSMVKTRLERPLKRKKNDWNKLTKVLRDEELRLVVVAEDSLESILEKNYQSILVEYNSVLDRLARYADGLF